MLEVGDIVRIKDQDEIKEDCLATTDGNKCHLTFNNVGMSEYCGRVLSITLRQDRIVKIIEDSRFRYQTIYQIYGCDDYVWAEEWLIPIGGDLIVD